MLNLYRNAGAVLAVVLAAFTLGTTLPDLARVFGQPLYLFGYTTGVPGVISEVTPGTSAASAGVQPGDRFFLTSISPDQRIRAGLGVSVTPHDRIRVGFMRGGHATLAGARGGQILLVSVSADTLEPSYRAPLVAARELAALVFVVVGLALVLVRSSLMTWGFFLFCCAFNPAPTAIFRLSAPFAIVTSALIANSIILSAGAVGLALFALRFPSGRTHGWRTIAEKIVLSCCVLLAAIFVYETAMELIVGEFTLGNQIGFGIVIALTVLAFRALIGTYAASIGAERARIQWVVFGSGASLIAFGVQLIFVYMPYWLSALLLIATTAMPLTVAYAVIRHRVIDVNFVVSRALVYAVLTSLLVGIFTLIDWLIGKVLEQTRLALATEVVAALGLGFWINGLHRRIDLFIDSVLFRQRYLAARRLARAAAGLPHATDAAAVDEMLVNEPADALKLASAALFRHRDGAGYTRELALNWPDDATRALGESEQLVLQLKGEHGPLRLDDVRWPRQDLPKADRMPALAIPIFVRDRLIAIALYGSHVNGEALDPDETGSIERLATGASAAYDHLEARALQREVEELRARLTAGRT